MTTSHSEPNEKPPVDHELMMRVHAKMKELGELLCEFSDRLTPTQELAISDLLPHYASILTDMGMILDLNEKTAVINSFHPSNVARRGQA